VVCSKCISGRKVGESSVLLCVESSKEQLVVGMSQKFMQGKA